MPANRFYDPLIKLPKALMSYGIDEHRKKLEDIKVKEN